MTTMSDTELSLLTIREGQVAFDEDQKKAIVDVLRVRHATDADLAVFFHMAVKTRLDPFRRQLYMIARQEWDPETNSKQWRQTFQTGIDGYRVIAERDAAKRGVQLKKARFQYWDHEGNVTDAWWKSEPPAMIRATVQLGDDEPVIWDARFDEYVPLKDEYEDVTDEQGNVVKGSNGKKQTRKTGRRVPQGMWATRPTAQLEKCAEAGALRRACPEDLSNLYVDAEMQRDDVEPASTVLVDDGSAPGGRDWIAEAEHAKDADTLREIWRSSAAKGEKSPSVMAAIRKRTAELRKEEEDKKKKGETDTERVETTQDVSAEPLVSERAGEVVAEPSTPETEALAAEAEEGFDSAKILAEARVNARVHAPDEWDKVDLNQVEDSTACGLEYGELPGFDSLVTAPEEIGDITCTSCRAALGLDD